VLAGCANGDADRERGDRGEPGGRAGPARPGLALRFELFAAAVLLLLGAGPSSSPPPWSGAAGSRSCARCGPRAGPAGRDRGRYVGTGALIALAVGTGAVAALVAEAAATASLPFFADGWRCCRAARIAFVPLLARSRSP
jgi:hypothetical protein